MSLYVSDVLGKKKVKKLLQCLESNDLQYSTLISMYQSVQKKKLDLIREQKTSFLDVLVGWEFTNAGPSKLCKGETLRNGIYAALIQKIRVGLIAIDKLPMPKICSQILQSGPDFASENLVRKVCESNPQYFCVKNLSGGSVVQITQARSWKSDEESSKYPPATSQAKELLKHFYKAKPGLIVAFDHNARFRDILHAYDFWEMQASGEKEGDFMNWLLTLAKEKSRDNFLKYQHNLEVLLGNRIVELIKPSPRTMSDILENLCIGRKRFLTLGMVRMVVLKNSGKMFVADNTNNMAVGKQLVKATESGKSALGAFDLPDRLESRVKPLLTLRTTYESILSNFKIVYQDRQMVESVAKSGCFLNYLVEYGKVHKEKLPSEEYTRHLYSFVKPFLLSVFEATCPKTPRKTVIECVLSEAPKGFLDAPFIRDAAQFYGSDFEITPENDIALRSKEEEPSPEKTVGSSPIMNNPAADLESPGVMHLLAKRPSFGEIMVLFSTLSAPSVSILANNSMSFFEWLISLSKRLMPHDAPIFESHLQRVVQEEVGRVHSRQRCQMTVQHVHCLLCAGQPMMLSPNFLSWCLEQPESPFSVCQSWIYVKRGDRSRSEEMSHQPSTSAEVTTVQDSAFSADDLLQSVREFSRLSDLHQALRAVSLENVGFALQNGASWYDYLENNLRDRKDREILMSLLTEEAKECLKSGILLTEELRLMLSKGVAHFVSKDSLEYVLRHNRETFALSGMGKENCKVGLIRQIQGNEVECFNSREETLLYQILLYFPSSGSSDIATILCLIRREDSFLHKKNEMIDTDFLQCFFKMFPMLFYLREDVVMLTCMALDKKAAYKNALYPTSTTGAECNQPRSSKQGSFTRNSSRKRRRSRSRRDSRSDKKKRTSNEHQSSIETASSRDASAEVIVIDESPDEETTLFAVRAKDEMDAMLVVDETKEENEFLKNVVRNLPGGLVTDITSSILMKNDGHYSTNDLLVEILFATTGADEGQQIQASVELFSSFKKKIFEVLRRSNAKFVLVPSLTVPDDIAEVKMANAEEEPENNAKDAKSSESRKESKNRDSSEPQVEEITSTSASPERPYSPPESPSSGETGDARTTHRSPEDDVIKLPVSSVDFPSTSHVPDYTTKVKETIEEERSRDAVLTTSVGASKLPKTYSCRTPDRPIPPSYSSSPACNSYAKEAPTYQLVRHESSRINRENHFMDFFKSYLKINARTCTTELLIGSAYRRFQGERFARSALAFEAYVFDFIVKHRRTFVLSGTSTELGVSKVFYRRGSPNTSPEILESSNLDFLKLEQEVCSSCCSYLSTQPDQRSSIADLCTAMKGAFQRKLEKIPDNEIDCVIRCLVLVATIRNLAMFCFAVQEPSLYLRNHKRSEESRVPHRCQTEIGAIMQNRAVKKAVLLMAQIVNTSRPRSQTNLRRLWQAEAPADVAKVFGTGISFTLALRKYSFLFPTSEDGSVSVNEGLMSILRRG